MYGLCLRLLSDPEEARDAAQEAFTRAYSSLESYDLEQAFAPWVLRIARNHCLDLLRRRIPAARGSSSTPRTRTGRPANSPTPPRSEPTTPSRRRRRARPWNGPSRRSPQLPRGRAPLPRRAALLQGDRHHHGNPPRNGHDVAAPGPRPAPEPARRPGGRRHDRHPSPHRRRGAAVPRGRARRAGAQPDGDAPRRLPVLPGAGPLVRGPLRGALGPAAGGAARRFHRRRDGPHRRAGSRPCQRASRRRRGPRRRRRLPPARARALRAGHLGPGALRRLVRRRQALQALRITSDVLSPVVSALRLQIIVVAAAVGIPLLLALSRLATPRHGQAA